ncbi:hypothetical protein [Saccharopolyspora spinosa]|nr:hypothetical protein [Saccharopolyspora spinosa]
MTAVVLEAVVLDGSAILAETSAKGRNSAGGAARAACSDRVSR